MADESIAGKVGDNDPLDWLTPPEDGLFDIRSRDPKPGMRVLGAFVSRDYFVGLVPRTRRLLQGEKDWQDAISECNREWQRCFHALRPYIGATADDYLSNCTCVDV